MSRRPIGFMQGIFVSARLRRRWPLHPLRIARPRWRDARSASSRAAVLAGVPFALAFDLDAGAVDRQVQRAVRAPVRDVHGRGSLPAAERAEVGPAPVQADRPQQALHEPGRLPKRHAETRSSASDGSGSPRRRGSVGGHASRWAYPPQAVAGSSQIASEPRRSSASSQPRRFRVSWVGGVGSLTPPGRHAASAT